VGRLVRLSLLAAAVAAVWTATASAGDLFVGADEDAAMWSDQPVGTVARALGLKALRVTVQWHPGETALAASDRASLDQAVSESWGLRLVVSVWGAAADAPRTQDARDQYCAFAGDLLRSYPTVNDVVVWNDPNDDAFWSPQFAPDGTSVAPADYEALLATCWDDLHALRPAVNLVALSASRPASVVLASHTTAQWWKEVGDAYRQSGRQLPIFDTVGHIPHPVGSAERPWAQHGTTGPIGEGDYVTLMSTLTAAFAGTNQPVPGQGSTSIWYLGDGFQTVPDPSKASLYHGRETDPSPLPAWTKRDIRDPRVGNAPDQATQLVDAVTIAYCQPAVGAIFNFHLADESDLAGWQSGVLWSDWTPKPSFAAFRNVVGQVDARAIDCGPYEVNGVPLRPSIAPPLAQLKVTNVRLTALTPFSATLAWHTSIPVRSTVAYGISDNDQALWATVHDSGLDHQATLGGLAAASAYRVQVTATAADAQQAQVSRGFTTPGLPASPSVSVGQGDILLNGQPFFPFMLWSQCPYEYGQSLAVGIDLFAENPCGGFDAQLSALGGRALSAAVAGEPAATGAGIVGWFYPDEADGLGMTGDTLPQPPSVPGISFLTLTNHFFSGSAPLSFGRGVFPGLIARADVVGFDLYVLQEWCRPDRLGAIYDAQQELTALAPGKPTYQWIESAGMGCPTGPAAVTPATVRAESWLAIAGGAHGLGFFPATGSTDVAQAIGGITHEVASLQPALLAPTTAASSDNAAVKVGARSLGGALYVVAVNTSYGPSEATISLPGLGGRPLTVFGEGRTVRASGDTFADAFDGLGVHVYVVAPADG
jgi:hypothetical protein